MSGYLLSLVQRAAGIAQPQPLRPPAPLPFAPPSPMFEGGGLGEVSAETPGSSEIIPEARPAPRAETPAAVPVAESARMAPVQPISAGVQPSRGEPEQPMIRPGRIDPPDPPFVTKSAEKAESPQPEPMAPRPASVRSGTTPSTRALLERVDRPEPDSATARRVQTKGPLPTAFPVAPEPAPESPQGPAQAPGPAASKPQKGDPASVPPDSSGADIKRGLQIRPDEARMAAKQVIRRPAVRSPRPSAPVEEPAAHPTGLVEETPTVTRPRQPGNEPMPRPHAKPPESRPELQSEPRPRRAEPLVAIRPLPPPQPRIPPMATSAASGWSGAKRSVQVRIGTVEVKAPPPVTTAPAPAPTQSPAPRTQGFGDYAPLRSFCRHGW